MGALILSLDGRNLPMVETHRSHHRPGPRHHIRDLLNCLPVAQRVSYRITFHDAADATLHDGDAVCIFAERNARAIPPAANDKCVDVAHAFFDRFPFRFFRLVASAVGLPASLFREEAESRLSRKCLISSGRFSSGDFSDEVPTFVPNVPFPGKPVVRLIFRSIWPAITWLATGERSGDREYGRCESLVRRV